jgi:uroporphyrinogen decarboxylase
MMYRADEIINQKVMQHFGIPDDECWEQGILSNLGADFISGGASLSEYSTYIPQYVGPHFDADYDKCLFYTFGINSRAVYDEEGRFFMYDYFQRPPLASAQTVDDIRRHEFPKPNWYDFTRYTTMITRKSPFGTSKDADEGHPSSEGADTEYVNCTDIKTSDDHFTCTYFNSSVFIICSYMRGMERLLYDLAAEPKLAHALVERVGEACVDLNKALLASIGKRIEVYGIWDDFAGQDNLLMSPGMWRRHFKPYYKRLIEEAKKYDLLVYFHCCGDLFDVIPDLIELGVDILDPIQTSARRMKWEDLKREFGKRLCFHGGIDIQKLLTYGTPAEVKQEVSVVKELFDGEGGVILGPSHLMTRDVPVENIVALYA